ncbi:MAG: relaxase/mobilization nuclease domain-containing protein, partial [Acidobacteria bacterium]|nr:relaxase/mobilization nuclease domain-containing protein [Acidobacteriota bacterium]
MMAKVIGFTATAAQTLDYLHQDKGVAGTGRRVGWAHNVNCIQASASETERMWAQLVADAPELKRQAGRSSRGRRLEKPYAHYVFSWHPADNPSGDEMMNAVRDAMQELRYGRCQYRVVCHEDKAHLHAHVIVCRVHPEHGRAMGRNNDNDVMYRWSTEYEKAQGKIRSPGRLEDITARCRYRREVRAGQQPTAPGPEAKRRRSARRHRRRNTRDAIGRPISHTKEERDEWRTLLQSNPKRGEKAALKRRQTAARIVAGNARADRLEAAARPKPTPAPVALPLAPERPRTDLARVPLDGPAAPDPKPTPARVTLVPAPERPRTDLGAVALEDPIRTPAPPGRVSLAPAPARPRAGPAPPAPQAPDRPPRR